MNIKKSHICLITLFAAALLLAVTVLLSFRARMLCHSESRREMQKMEPLPIDSVSLPRLSADVPWHRITFHETQSLRGRDTLLPVIRTDPPLTCAEIYIEHPAVMDVVSPLEVAFFYLQHNLRMTLDGIVSAVSYQFSWVPDADNAPVSLNIRVLNSYNTILENKDQNLLYKRSNYTITDSLLFRDGSYYMYHDYGAPNIHEEFNCRWIDGPWLTRITVETQSSQQRKEGLFLLNTVRDQLFDYYRDLNRQYAEGSS